MSTASVGEPAAVNFVGGAIVPLVTGSFADALSIASALSVPIACYCVIAAFGLFARKPLAA